MSGLGLERDAWFLHCRAYRIASTSPLRKGDFAAAEPAVVDNARR